MDRETIVRRLAEKGQLRSPVQSFNMQGYCKEPDKSGALICTHISSYNTKIKKCNVFIEDYPKDDEITIIVKISNETDTLIKIPIKESKAEIECDQTIMVYDRISVFIEYPNEDKKPRGVWFVTTGA